MARTNLMHVKVFLVLDIFVEVVKMATVDVLNFAAYVSISCFLASSSASLPQKELSKLLVTLIECVLLCPKLK